MSSILPLVGQNVWSVLRSALEIDELSNDLELNSINHFEMIVHVEGEWGQIQMIGLVKLEQLGEKSSIAS